MPALNCQDLITLFNNLFAHSQNTVLIGGASEPLYLPQDKNATHHKIFFTQDYFASALHEIAHWCIAGKVRRELIDYGYWYLPDGRSLAEQQLFQDVEVKPQALEWIFAQAAGSQFSISVDNLSGMIDASEQFKLKVHQQALYYMRNRLPPRAEKFTASLQAFYQREKLFSESLFNLEFL